jgi:RNA polymerase sigma factor (TIGR02999 family)
MADEVTVLLERVARGDSAASAELFPLVYQQLRQQAQQYMAGERSGHTLQATALVNEAYVRLVGGANIDFQDRRHFFQVAAQAMRRILVDHARARKAAKRGLGAAKVDVADVSVASAEIDPAIAVADAEAQITDFEALDEAMKQLEQMDARRHQVVMYRYFAGLQVNQIAELLGVDRKTVQRDWDAARAFLLVAMESKDEG